METAQGLRTRKRERDEKCRGVESKQPLKKTSHPLAPLVIALWKGGSSKFRHVDGLFT